MDSAEITVNAAKIEFEKSFKEEKFYNKQTQDDKHLDLLLSKMEISDGMKILDLGTGSGYLAFAVAVMNPNVEVIGLDVVAETLRRNESRAKSENLKNIKFRAYDGIEFMFDDGEFDCIITRYALHHFPKIDMTFREMSRVLKDGGRLIISDPTPNEDDADKFVDEFMQMKPDGHIRFYSLSEFVELGEKADLRFVSNQYTEIRFPRQNVSAYIPLLSQHDEHVIENYNIKIEGDEIYITEKILNIVFEKE